MRSYEAGNYNPLSLFRRRAGPSNRMIPTVMALYKYLCRCCKYVGSMLRMYCSGESADTNYLLSIKGVLTGAIAGQVEPETFLYLRK